MNILTRNTFTFNAVKTALCWLGAVGGTQFVQHGIEAHSNHYIWLGAFQIGLCALGAGISVVLAVFCWYNEHPDAKP